MLCKSLNLCINMLITYCPRYLLINLFKSLVLTPTMFDHRTIIDLYFAVPTLDNFPLDIKLWVPSLGTVFSLSRNSIPISIRSMKTFYGFRKKYREYLTYSN